MKVNTHVDLEVGEVGGRSLNGGISCDPKLYQNTGRQANNSYVTLTAGFYFSPSGGWEELGSP